MALSSGDNAYYLKSLNRLEEVGLDVYKNLQNSFSDAAIMGLLEQLDWRGHLIAYTFAMCLAKREFLPALIQRAKTGSMVTPQLISAIAILSKRDCADTLRHLLADASTSFKTKGAIFAVMPYCSIYTISFNADNIDVDAFNMGMEIASTHLDYWSHRELLAVK